jgi:hypothetical protein
VDTLLEATYPLVKVHLWALMARLVDLAVLAACQAAV